jgi:hypothetical protein
MTNRRRGGLAFVVATGLVLLVGCGGGEEQTDTAATEEPAEVVLTKGELIAEADGVCAEVNAAIGTINSAESTEESVKAAQRADLYDGLADRLEELGDPSDGSPPTAVIAAARALGNSDADASDLEAFQEAADEYGFSACAEDPRAPLGTPSTSDGGGSGTSEGSSGATPAPAPAPAPAPGTGGGASPSTPGSGGGSSPSGGISPG